MRNQIINGDCAEILKTMPGASVDLVVTDPPYLVKFKDRSGRSIRNDDSPDNVLACFPDLYRVMKPDSFCVCFYGWNTVDLFMSAWRAAGFAPVGHIVWKKNYSSRTGYLKATHEQAYLLAKGRPRRPAEPLPDVQPWEYTGNRRQRKPKGKPMPKRTARANAAKSAVRARVEHPFAHQKGPMALVIRTIGLARAKATVTLANIAYNMKRWCWLDRRSVPA